MRLEFQNNQHGHLEAYSEPQKTFYEENLFLFESWNLKSSQHVEKKLGLDVLKTDFEVITEWSKPGFGFNKVCIWNCI